MTGVCGCDYGLSPCTAPPEPGGTLCVFCLGICVPLSQGINPFDPPFDGIPADDPNP